MLRLVFEMIDDDSHRDYAIRVLEFMEPFVTRRVGALSIGEMNLLTFQLNRLIGALTRLPAPERAHTGSDQVKVGLERAKERVLLQARVIRPK
jgi:hypothetical protein